LLPYTVSVKALPPAVADAGEIELIDGTGLEGGGVVVPPDDEPPPQPAAPSATRRRMSCAPLFPRV